MNPQDDEQLRDTIERRANEMTAGPNEQNWDQMVQDERDVEEQAVAHPGWSQGQDIPVQDVPEDERLQEPTGTDSDGH